MWRTETAKLILYPTPPSDGEDCIPGDYHGELYELETDPSGRVNRYRELTYEDI